MWWCVRVAYTEVMFTFSWCFCLLGWGGGGSGEDNMWGTKGRWCAFLVWVGSRPLVVRGSLLRVGLGSNCAMEWFGVFNGRVYTRRMVVAKISRW
ncbi:hypothetical protein F5148DRAFT_1196976 [Russula earlei]|uniref:Uncharacterized protein n=1 Tax=Russula earlei TaxID=71964 RepID=A0ACC0UC04_9AGAM|nr:hypothetical protein F5148DRAFT_1196976 [Russula earlei]